MTEKDLQNEVRMLLSDHGFIPFRANVGRLKTVDGRWLDIGLPAGFSDVFAVKDGKAYFFEIKVKPNRPSKKQIQFIEQMQQNGCTAEVIYSTDDLKQAIGVPR